MNVVTLLETRGIQPSAQRVAVAEYVLHTERHPTAEQVLAGVRARFPRISRATVYNTLNLFVEKGLLRSFPRRTPGVRSEDGPPPPLRRLADRPDLRPALGDVSRASLRPGSRSSTCASTR